jgi:hypothetical protein
VSTNTISGAGERLVQDKSKGPQFSGYLREKASIPQMRRGGLLQEEENKNNIL